MGWVSVVREIDSRVISYRRNVPDEAVAGEVVVEHGLPGRIIALTAAGVPGIGIDRFAAARRSAVLLGDGRRATLIRVSPSGASAKVQLMNGGAFLNAAPDSLTLLVREGVETWQVPTNDGRCPAGGPHVWTESDDVRCAECDVRPPARSSVTT